MFMGDLPARISLQSGRGEFSGEKNQQDSEHDASTVIAKVRVCLEQFQTHVNIGVS